MNSWHSKTNNTLPNRSISSSSSQTQTLWHSIQNCMQQNEWVIWKMKNKCYVISIFKICCIHATYNRVPNLFLVCFNLEIYLLLSMMKIKKNGDKRYVSYTYDHFVLSFFFFFFCWCVRFVLAQRFWFTQSIPKCSILNSIQRRASSFHYHVVWSAFSTAPSLFISKRL